MRLAAILDRCLSLERRAGDMYRRFAGASGGPVELCAVWRRFAAEEDEHAAAIAIARATVDPAIAEQSHVGGWEDALARAEEVLTEAERTVAATPDDQLTLALDLERTEIDVLRHALLLLAGQAGDTGPDTSRHALELADVAGRHSTDARVQLREAMIRAHERLGAEHRG